MMSKNLDKGKKWINIREEIIWLEKRGDNKNWINKCINWWVIEWKRFNYLEIRSKLWIYRI